LLGIVIVAIAIPIERGFRWQTLMDVFSFKAC